MVRRVAIVLVALCLGCADEVDDCQCPSGSDCDVEGVCRLSCDDIADCTMCEVCRMGVCLPLSSCRCTTPANCTDDDPCNGEEICDANGRCAAGQPFPCSHSTDDCFDNVCVNTAGIATCELEPSGACPCVSIANCDDDDPCNGQETCVDNNCYPGTPFDCPPATVTCRVNVCVDDNGAPACQLQLAQIDTVCDDGVACTDGACDALGDCVGSPTECDDGISCTDDACDQGLDQCEFIINHDSCDDSATCTTDICDPVGDCVFTPDHSVCTDGNSCTDDRCAPASGVAITGCHFPFNNVGCDDGDECTTADFCSNGACTGEPGADFMACGGGDFCLAGDCVTESSSRFDPPLSPCVQNWHPLGVERYQLVSGVTKFIGAINATFHNNGAECVGDATYLYVRALSGGQLHDSVQLFDVDFNLVPRMPVTATVIEDGLMAARSPSLGAALAERRQSQVSFEINTSTVNQAIDTTVMGWPYALARVGEREFFVGGTGTAGEGMISNCTNPGGGYNWECDSSNRLAVAAREDNIVVAMHAAIDPNTDTYRGLIIAAQHSSGSFRLMDDGLATGIVDSDVDGDDIGPWLDSVIRGVVARAWNDVFFFGEGSIVVECINPPAWACSQLDSLHDEWAIVGGAVSPSGHLFLVGPYTVTGNPSGNHLVVLPAGTLSTSPASWVSLPMSFASGQRANAVAASTDEIQVLGISASSTIGDRPRVWSFEAP